MNNEITRPHTDHAGIALDLIDSVLAVCTPFTTVDTLRKEAHDQVDEAVAGGWIEASEAGVVYDSFAKYKMR